jgi:hypothetical protein
MRRSVRPTRSDGRTGAETLRDLIAHVGRRVTCLCGDSVAGQAAEAVLISRAGLPL